MSETIDFRTCSHERVVTAVYGTHWYADCATCGASSLGRDTAAAALEHFVRMFDGTQESGRIRRAGGWVLPKNGRRNR